MSRFRKLSRRDAAKSLLAVVGVSQLARGSTAKAPHILLRSSWQTVNIGDIAHTPGALALIERHVPNSEVRLWASSDMTSEVASMLHRRFPSLVIVKGTIQEDGQASTPELNEALHWCDFLLHGSGPSLVARDDVENFVSQFNKPFGVFGITRSPKAPDAAILNRARFVFFRDPISLEFARQDNIRAPIMEFGPDAAFACDLSDTERAYKFMSDHALESGQFVCCLSRLRFTPYWSIPSKNMPLDEVKHTRNQEMKEHDHAAIRHSIVSVVRQLGLKVLLCPEDQTQIAVAKELLWDPLPEDVRTSVVRKETFWLTDEALSVYKQSAGLFGSEMHSPIMALGNRVPAIVCRFSEQTTKGYMWDEIGLGEWLFNLDDKSDHDRIEPAVLSMLRNREHSTEKVSSALKIVQTGQDRMCEVLRDALT